MRDSSSDDLPRFAADMPLPPYTYVPGRAPHPISDPAGHSFGKHIVAAAIGETTWPIHLLYLHAVDLFNRGYYWEAHEAWEAVWHAVGRHGPTADLLKGLIKLAAAGVKVREDRPPGVVSHSQRAAELFDAAKQAGGRHQLGLDLDELAAAARSLVDPPATLDAPPEDVRPVLGISIEPRAG